MKGFDESWLRDYQRRQAQHTAPEPPHIGDYSFILKKPLMLPNRKKTLHWAKQSQLIHALSQEVAQAIGQGPPQPIPKAHVKVFRYGIQEPDHDNIVGSLKGILDVLQPRSHRHPYGLGIIAGDDPEHLISEIHHIQVKTLAEQKTKVVIREIKP
ncbi:MAG TPA: hypothetical protein VMP68_09155 [Candidatus Eisenbacteria bacterium]|nr:hypothetical protein [Candidatus Eisenbacteria bacterium]